MAPPVAGFGPTDEAVGRSQLTPERLTRVRAIIFALTLFVWLVVWIYHSLGPTPAREAAFLTKLRGVGILTWIYALVQMLDMRFYNSRFSQRRRASMRIPDSLLGWLFGQMVAWFGIVYYGFTQDLRWYIAGLVILLLSFVAFPIRRPYTAAPPDER
ncbi:MAG TPA: hypothetical protein VMH39_03030 [Gemmatimonadaceae bacterium]|nr:hypothetical protein [Gemmatimonadaceae bacterium]